MEVPKKKGEAPRVSLNLMFVPTETKGLQAGDIYKKEDGTLMCFGK